MAEESSNTSSPTHLVLLVNGGLQAGLLSLWCLCRRMAASTDTGAHCVALRRTGIWGGRWDWTRFAARLVEHPSVGPVLVHASGVNTAFRTGDGGCRAAGRS